MQRLVSWTPRTQMHTLKTVDFVDSHCLEHYSNSKVAKKAKKMKTIFQSEKFLKIKEQNQILSNK